VYAVVLATLGFNSCCCRLCLRHVHLGLDFVAGSCSQSYSSVAQLKAQVFFVLTVFSWWLINHGRKVFGDISVRL
jgi:hypothetical protein